jgi:pleiotropic regulator 1
MQVGGKRLDMFHMLAPSGSRLITCEADKTVKMWKEVEDATESTHPNLPYKPPKDIRRF